jgi:hypothetical protein
MLILSKIYAVKTGHPQVLKERQIYEKLMRGRRERFFDFK